MCDLDVNLASDVMVRAADNLECLIGNAWRWGLNQELVEMMDKLRAEIREEIGKEESCKINRT